MLLLRLPKGIRFRFHRLHGFSRKRGAADRRNAGLRIWAANGNTATRNSCPLCHSLVLGGAIGKDSTYNIYAGSLDDPSLFHPTIAVFTRGRPEWAVIPSDLKILDIGK